MVGPLELLLVEHWVALMAAQKVAQLVDKLAVQMAGQTEDWMVDLWVGH